MMHARNRETLLLFWWSYQDSEVQQQELRDSVMGLLYRRAF